MPGRAANPAPRSSSSLSHDAVASLHSQLAQARSAAPHARLRKRAGAVAARWAAALSRAGADPSSDPDADPDSLFALAVEAGVPPCLLLRRLLEAPPFGVAKGRVTDILRAPSTLPARVPGSALPPAALAAASAAAAAATAGDALASPRADAVRHVSGLEAEALLCARLAAAGIPFWAEGGLRAGGFAATPDARLAVPAATGGGHVVHWIDSKAAFGAIALHAAHLEEQYARYVSRYGSGLVIYWAGFDARLAPRRGRAWRGGVAVADGLPRDLVALGGLPLPPRAAAAAARVVGGGGGG